MAYRVEGLPLQKFVHLFGLDDAALARQGAERRVAEAKPGAPCRITLQDAEPGETLTLLNHVSHDVAGPYRATHAIFVSEKAMEATTYIDEVPPVFAPRILSMRDFDEDGMMVDAMLAQPGEAEDAIFALFDNPAVATTHAHNAIRGCFAARIERN